MDTLYMTVITISTVALILVGLEDQVEKLRSLAASSPKEQKRSEGLSGAEMEKIGTGNLMISIGR